MTHSDGGVEDWSLDPNDLEGTRRELQVQMIKFEGGGPRKETVLKSTRHADETQIDYTLWHRLVGTYSRRSLSYPADKLPAISAVAAEFSKLANDTYLAGLWRSNLLRDLLWTTPDPAVHHPKIWRAPTWSWASVNEAIIYKRLTQDSATILAQVIDVEVVPLTEVAPFGEVERGTLVLSAPGFPVTFKDEESRAKISKPWLDPFKFTPGKSERDMLFNSLRNSVGSAENDYKGDEKKDFQLPDEIVVLFLYGKRDELYQSNKSGLDVHDTMQRWSIWGLILTEVGTGLGEPSYERLLSFSEYLVTTDESLFSIPRKFRIV